MTVAQKTQIDTEKMDAFVEKFLGVMNGAGLAMMISIGHRTGLFDALGEMDQVTCEELAAKANLQKRYVREWLGAMVAGDVVEYEPSTQRYQLPAEHAAILTRASAPNNLSVSTQFIAQLGSVETKVVECFQNGGGVEYAEFDRFHEVMREESDQTVCAALVEHILPLAPGLKEKLEQGIQVMDVGCGSGHAMMTLATAFPNSQFRGTDMSSEATQYATHEAKRRGLKNITFDVCDAALIQETETYDLVTAFDAIHDQRDPAGVLMCIHKALKPNGMFLMQDIDTSTNVENNSKHPLGAFLYTISCMHCMTVSLAQCGAGLGACWGVEKAESMLNEAGFANVKIERLPHDVMNAFFICQIS